MCKHNKINSQISDPLNSFFMQETNFILKFVS